MRVEMVKAGPERYQNKEGLFKPAIRVIKEGDKEKESLSFLSKKWFYKTLKNGDEVLRLWLLYSNSHSELYYFCCKLFQSRNDNSQFLFIYFISIFILLTRRKAMEELIHRISNYPHLLPEMSRYCCPLVI